MKTVHILLCALLLATGCKIGPRQRQSMLRQEQGSRLTAAPAGQALVNLHRPGLTKSYKNYNFLVFDHRGVLLAELPIQAETQIVMEPGDHVFVGWYIATAPVSVVKADLAADKVYDLYVLEGFNDRPRLEVLHWNDPTRSRLVEWESTEALMVLERTTEITAVEADVRPRIEQIKADFLSGPKSDRVRTLQREDCR